MSPYESHNACQACAHSLIVHNPLVGKGAGSVLKGAGQSVGHVFGGGK